MERIINFKKYSTDESKSKCVAYWDNGQCGTDFRYYSEDLYRTHKGAWFLRKEGGPMSVMAVSVGNNGTGGSSTLVALTEEEVREWLIERQQIDILEEMFGEVEDA